MLDITVSPNYCRTACLTGTFRDTSTSRCVTSCPNGLLIDTTTTPSSCVSTCVSPKLTDITKSPQQCVSACPNGTYQYSLTCTDQCQGTLLADFTTTPRKCVSECSNSSYFDKTSTPQSCLTACPSTTVVNTISTPQQCLSSCPSGLYRDVTVTPSPCLTQCPSKLIPIPQLNTCEASCPAPYPLHDQRINRCVSECLSDQYSANNACYTCDPVVCQLLGSFQIRNVTEQASYVTVVVWFNSSTSTNSTTVQNMKAVVIQVEADSRMLGTSDNEVASSRVTSGLMTVSFKSTLALKYMQRLGIVVNINEKNYTTQYLSLSNATVNYYNNVRISSIVVGSLLLAGYLPLKGLGLRYNYMLSWQLAMFYLYSSNSSPTDFFNLLTGLSLTDFQFMDPFLAALPASWMELLADSINAYGMNLTYLSSIGGALLFLIIAEALFGLLFWFW